MTPPSIVVWFNRAFKSIGLKGCSSHSGRQNVRHPRGAVGAQGRRLAARCSTAGRSPVDPDDAAVHRRRQRCAAQTGLDDLRPWPPRRQFSVVRPSAKNIPKFTTGQPRIDHAVRVIYRVCCLAGSANLIDKIRADLDADGVRAAMRKRDTAAVFDWLIAALSYQGISDQIAYDYMEQHGYVRWDDINQKLGRKAPLAPSSRATGISMAADTTSSAGPAPSPITSAAVRCRPMTCATAASTRPPIRCTCSFATLPMAI